MKPKIPLAECRKVMARHGWEVRRRVLGKYECFFHAKDGFVIPEFKSLCNIRFLTAALLNEERREMEYRMQNPPEQHPAEWFVHA